MKATQLNLKPAPYTTYGYEYGGSPGANAIGFMKNNNQMQSQLNKTHGGSSGRSRVSVPQFPQSGPEVSPVGANSSSVGTNTTAITGTNDAMNDCFATNSCGSAITGGNRNRNRKHRHTKRHSRNKNRTKRTRHLRKSRKHKRKSRK